MRSAFDPSPKPRPEPTAAPALKMDHAPQTDEDPAELVRWLNTQGWTLELSHGNVCRHCHHVIAQAFAWASPKYAFYHRRCLFANSRGQRLLTRFRKQCQAQKSMDHA